MTSYDILRLLIAGVIGGLIPYVGRNFNKARKLNNIREEVLANLDIRLHAGIDNALSNVESLLNALTIVGYKNVEFKSVHGLSTDLLKSYSRHEVREVINPVYKYMELLMILELAEDLKERNILNKYRVFTDDINKYLSLYEPSEKELRKTDPYVQTQIEALIKNINHYKLDLLTIRESSNKLIQYLAGSNSKWLLRYFTRIY